MNIALNNPFCVFVLSWCYRAISFLYYRCKMYDDAKTILDKLFVLLKSIKCCGNTLQPFSLDFSKFTLFLFKSSSHTRRNGTKAY